MNDALFISDLHLHVDNLEITSRFFQFLQWAKLHTKSLYILGDFFHVWVGDDFIGAFEKRIAEALSELVDAGIEIYFMPGNRDFLIGDYFLKLSKMKLLPDPCVVDLSGDRVFLTHGDAYCTHDRMHQFLRLITRPIFFKDLLLSIPYSIRAKIVHKVRSYSQQKKHYLNASDKKYQINQKKLFKDMAQYHVLNTIYGHIHRPNHLMTSFQHSVYNEYILSDWDDIVSIICYNKLNGFYFHVLNEKINV